jgi:hypothetical protein
MKNKKDLIAQISQNVAPALNPPPLLPESVPPEVAERQEKEPTRHSSATTVSPTTGTGKQAAFWLDDEDRAIFHEMGMVLYSQGIKPSYNLVLRAAIRMVPRDHQLVEKVRYLIENDGRKLRHQKKTT